MQSFFPPTFYYLLFDINNKDLIYTVINMPKKRKGYNTEYQTTSIQNQERKVFLKRGERTKSV